MGWRVLLRLLAAMDRERKSRAAGPLRAAHARQREREGLAGLGLDPARLRARRTFFSFFRKQQQLWF